MIPVAEEARYLHDAFFSQPLDAVTVDRYAAANDVCFPSQEERGSELIGRIVARRLDVEAVEVALRRRAPGNPLTKKIQILFYLVEARSAYYRDFINDRDSFGPALAAIASSVIRTAWKSAKGAYLVWRHDLA